MTYRLEDAEMIRQISSHAFKAEYSALTEKTRIYEERLHNMTNAQFDQAVIEYAEKLIKEHSDVNRSR
jgi:hypothetical protein